MKEYLRSLIAESRSPPEGKNRIREALQASLLASLQRAGAMIPLAFHGGTALRFLYSLPRYSEDLDFALERPERGYDFRALLQAVRAEFLREQYAVDVKANDRKAVHSGSFRFPGLLFDLGLSPHRTETLSIRLEVDSRPPAGAGLETTVVRRHVLLHLQHHDRPSLLAGKLHAVLARPFLKGRDLYDLVWYLADPQWPGPNLTLLNNALAQTGWEGPRMTARSWRRAVRNRLEGADWERAAADVAPFLETREEVALLRRDAVLGLLG